MYHTLWACLTLEETILCRTAVVRVLLLMDPFFAAKRPSALAIARVRTFIRIVLSTSGTHISMHSGGEPEAQRTSMLLCHLCCVCKG
jgi:hypothetical protein